MKVIAFAFLLAVASATPIRYASDIETAIPSGSERRVTGNIVSAIEDAAQSIRDAGLDPLYLPADRQEFALAVPSVFNARAHHNGIHSRGLSNIVINRMDYSGITNRLHFNIELPSIRLDINSAEVDVTCLGGNFNSKVWGSVEIKNIVVTGTVRIRTGLISGNSIRSIDVNLRLGAVQSLLNVDAQNVDLSPYINDFLDHKFPNALRSHEEDVDALITIYAREFLEAIL